jgi:hypothetical protein
MSYATLWLPILVSAVVVFVASSVLHMVFKYHNADHKRLPAEDGVRESLARANPAPGMYFTPHCSDHKQMKEPAVKEKFEKGPVAIITVLPKGLPMMPKYLALWFALCVFVSFVAAYVARHTLQPGADGMLVMRITGTVAFAGYALNHVSDSIWKGEPWANTFRHAVDGAIYSLLTGLVFRLMWPAA